MDKHPLLTEITDFCQTHQMAESTFGRLALGDWKLVKELRGEGRGGRPRRLWPETEQQIRDFMTGYEPAAPAAAADDAA